MIWNVKLLVWNCTSVWHCSCWGKYSKQVTFKMWVDSINDALRDFKTDSFWKTYDQLLSKSDFKMFIFDMCSGNICEWILNFFQQHLSSEFCCHYSEVMVKISVFHVSSPVTVAYLFSKVARCQPGTCLIDPYLKNVQDFSKQFFCKTFVLIATWNRKREWHSAMKQLFVTDSVLRN